MQRQNPPFTGIWPALLTPFDADDRLNLPAARRLIARLIEQKAAGLYICGSTGEAPLLRVEERRLFAEFVVKEVAGQIPVMVQVGHTAPALAVELAEHAAGCGADAVSSTLPPFYPYTVGQIAEYWTALGQTSDLPFYGYVMHDIGGACGQVHRWLDAIARVPNLAGVKFTNADAHQLALLKSWENGRLNILSGHDQGYLACRAQGADGAVGSTYNVALPMWRRVSRLYENGDTTSATDMMIRCCELVGRLASGFFLTRLKLVARKQGIDCGLPRIPLRADVDVPEAEIDELVEMIARCSVDTGPFPEPRRSLSGVASPARAGS